MIPRNAELWFLKSLESAAQIARSGNAKRCSAWYTYALLPLLLLLLLLPLLLPLLGGGGGGGGGGNVGGGSVGGGSGRDRRWVSLRQS